MTAPRSAETGTSVWCSHGYRQDHNYWHAWQEGRAWARINEFYGVPPLLGRRWARNVLYVLALAAPLILIAWALT